MTKRSGPFSSQVEGMPDVMEAESTRRVEEAKATWPGPPTAASRKRRRDKDAYLRPERTAWNASRVEKRR
jgi:hypothetical protein